MSGIPRGYEEVKSAIPKGYEEVKKIARDSEEYLRPFFEFGGMGVGAAIGAASPVLGGSVIGGGLGYGIGKKAADLLYGKEQGTIPEEMIRSAGDVGVGGLMELTGPVIEKGVKAVGGPAAKLGRQVIGKFTGAGEGAAAEAVKGGEAFTKAMRGKISGEEVVETARNALNEIKSARGAAYRQRLEELGKITGDIDTKALELKIADIAAEYNVKMVNGKFDFSRVTVGERGVRDLRKALDKISSWGTQPGDRTPAGLDKLKRILDDFYSESSGARAFIVKVNKAVKETITQKVPQYAEMTKGYAEATKIIKDIEAGLMLRKQGMTGRIYADMTLRRLTSAMKNNFALRKELLEILSKQGGEDVTGMVAGYSHSVLVPHGIQGIGASTAGTAAALKYLNPKFVPLIVMSSPRVAGEFLRMLGKFPGTSKAAGKVGAYAGVRYLFPDTDTEDLHSP